MRRTGPAHRAPRAQCDDVPGRREVARDARPQIGRRRCRRRAGIDLEKAFARALDRLGQCPLPPDARLAPLAARLALGQEVFP